MSEETPTTEATPNAVSFDVVTELNNAVAIIDYAAEQGAFKGWTVIDQVIACRGRLIAFVQMMEEAIRQTQPPEPNIPDEGIGIPDEIKSEFDDLGLELELVEESTNAVEVVTIEDAPPPPPDEAFLERQRELQARYERAAQELADAAAALSDTP